MNKRMFLNEFNDLNEDVKIFHSNPHTEIIIKNKETGEILFKGENRVVGSGGDMVARKLYDIDPSSIVIPSYNDPKDPDNINWGGLELDDPTSSEIDPSATFDYTSAKKDDPKVLLFAIGTDGCGTTGGEIFVVNYNDRIKPDSIIPLRYPLIDADLSPADRDIYFGRKEIEVETEEGETDTHVAYYFKRFTTDPALKEVYLDGTPIDNYIYKTGQEYEVYVQCKLDITKNDIREYFKDNMDLCRFNSISLLYGYPVKSTVDGYTYFLDVRPLTKLNISNEFMIDLSKGVEITYNVYF